MYIYIYCPHLKYTYLAYYASCIISKICNELPGSRINLVHRSIIVAMVREGSLVEHQCQSNPVSKPQVESK